MKRPIKQIFVSHTISSNLCIWPTDSASATVNGVRIFPGEFCDAYKWKDNINFYTIRRGGVSGVFGALTHIILTDYILLCHFTFRYLISSFPKFWSCLMANVIWRMIVPSIWRSCSLEIDWTSSLEIMEKTSQSKLHTCIIFMSGWNQ